MGACPARRPGAVLRLGSRELDLARPRVMGILNVTPDSFSDGGRHGTSDLAIAQGRRLAAEGADILDVGGESTRPGAAPVSLEDELARVIPVVRALAADGQLVSIDTMKPEVMLAAVEAGASMINDVNALQSPGALEAAASTGAAVCLMHMQGEPRTMQLAPRYVDVVGEVRDFLVRRAHACERAGIEPARVTIDPGFGFGKTVEHNLQLVRGLSAFAATGYPVLFGASRKNALGVLTGRGVTERLAASVAAALAAVARGAAIVRVHDVRETVDALKVWDAIGAG